MFNVSPTLGLRIGKRINQETVSSRQARRRAMILFSISRDICWGISKSPKIKVSCCRELTIINRKARKIKKKTENNFAEQQELSVEIYDILPTRILRLVMMIERKIGEQISQHLSTQPGTKLEYRLDVRPILTSYC